MADVQTSRQYLEYKLLNIDGGGNTFKIDGTKRSGINRNSVVNAYSDTLTAKLLCDRNGTHYVSVGSVSYVEQITNTTYLDDE